MTRFHDLTDAEVLALTDEQIEYHIEYECADSGAGLLPPDPGPAPEKPKDMKDFTVYVVGDMTFDTQEAALDVATAANRHSRFEKQYVSGPSYEQYVTRADSDVEVRAVRVYSAGGWDAAKALVNKYDADKKVWDGAVREFNRIAEARSQATGWIRERVDEVHAEERERVRVGEQFARYVELADGDETIARRFLLKARPDADKYLPPVSPEAAVPEP